MCTKFRNLADIHIQIKDEAGEGKQIKSNCDGMFAMFRFPLRSILILLDKSSRDVIKITWNNRRLNNIVTLWILHGWAKEKQLCEHSLQVEFQVLRAAFETERYGLGKLNAETLRFCVR